MIFKHFYLFIIIGALFFLSLFPCKQRVQLIPAIRYSIQKKVLEEIIELTIIYIFVNPVYHSLYHFSEKLECKP